MVECSKNYKFISACIKVDFIRNFQNPEAARISHLVTFFIILIMIERRINYQDGRIGYQDGSKPNGSKPPWGEVPFDLDKWLQEIDPGGWMDEDNSNGETRKINRDGIMSVASARGDREYLIMTLSRYYSPRDLYYKTIDELNDMLNMHLTETGGLV